MEEGRRVRDEARDGVSRFDSEVAMLGMTISVVSVSVSVDVDVELRLGVGSMTGPRLSAAVGEGLVMVPPAMMVIGK